MPSHHLPNDEFLTSLSTLLLSTHTSTPTPTTISLPSSSIFLTQKPHPTLPATLLLRASNGISKTTRLKDPSSKIKLSTLVELNDVPEFYQRYSEVCKRGMEGLRKRDKKKGKAARKKGKEKGKEKGKKAA